MFKHPKILFFILILCSPVFGGDFLKPPQNNQSALYFSYGKNEYTILEDLSYEFLSLDYFRQSDSGGTRITGGILQDYPTGYERNRKLLIFMPRLSKKWNNFSYNLGVCLGFKIQGDIPFSTFILPVGGIRFGDLDFLYGSINILNEDLMGIFEIGVNYKMLNNSALFTLGAFKFERWYIKIKIIPLRYIYLAISGAYDFIEKAPGFRIGIGTSI